MPINISALRQSKQTFGWMNNVLRAMAKNKRWAASLVKGNSILIAQTYPLVLATNGFNDLLSQCRIAAAGAGSKVFSQATHTGIADLDVALTGGICFGVKVRVTDSPLNFQFGGIRVGLLDNATVLGEVVIQANKLPAEAVILAINNTGGQATVVRNSVPIVRFFDLNSAVLATTQCYAETLNMRDLGDL